MAIKNEDVRDLEALMGEVPSHRRASLLPSALRLVKSLGGEPAEFEYMCKRRSDWAKRDGAHEYLVTFQDGPMMPGDARTFLASELEVLSLLSLKSESLRVLLINSGGALTRETRLGTTTLTRLRQSMTPAQRAEARRLEVREQDVFGKKGRARAY